MCVHRVIGRVQRLLGDDVDETARFAQPIEDRPRAFKHLDARHIGHLLEAVTGAAVQTETVAVDIAAGPKPPNHDGVIGVAIVDRAVRNRHAADILQRLGDVGDLLILQDLLADRLHVQRRVHDRRIGLGADASVLQDISGIVGVLRRASAAVSSGARSRACASARAIAVAAARNGLRRADIDRGQHFLRAGGGLGDGKRQTGQRHAGQKHAKFHDRL